MIGEKLILKLNKNTYSISEGRFLEVETLSNRNFKEAFWTFEITNYISNEKLIIAKLLSYQNGKVDFPINQKRLFEKLNIVKTIRFPDINTDGILRTERGLQEKSFSPKKEDPLPKAKKKTTPTQLINIGHPPEMPIKMAHDKPKENTEIWARQNNVIKHNLSTNIIKKPITITIKETFDIPIKKVQFKNGCVSIVKKFYEYDSPISIDIINNDIITEYDSIKNYFAKILKIKKVQISVNIRITNNVIENIEASSFEIEKITSKLIKNIKLEFVKTGLRRHKNGEKNIFTMEEFFENLEEGKIDAKIFYENENVFFSDLISISKPKHNKHLGYLSKIHESKKMKLRFLKKPLSFIFLTKVATTYCIVWETIDTKEATYIWDVGKNANNLKARFKEVETIITQILKHSKKEHIKSAPNNFKRVFHDYSEVESAFANWKNELKKALR